MLAPNETASSYKLYIKGSSKVLTALLMSHFIIPEFCHLINAYITETITLILKKINLRFAVDGPQALSSPPTTACPQNCCGQGHNRLQPICLSWQAQVPELLLKSFTNLGLQVSFITSFPLLSKLKIILLVRFKRSKVQVYQLPFLFVIFLNRNLNLFSKLN